MMRPLNQSARRGLFFASFFGPIWVNACDRASGNGPVTPARDPDMAEASTLDVANPYAVCGPPASYPPDDEAGCGPGAVTFQLTGQPGEEWWLTESQGSNSPSTNWLTLLSCDSQTMLSVHPTQETTSRDCTACPASWSLTVGTATWKLPTAGQTQTWDGTYVLPSACGNPPQPCVSPGCASAGRFIAQMCACAPADQTPDGCQNPVCVRVPFDYPAQAIVSGMLPAADP